MKEFRKDALCVNKGTKLCCPSYLEASVKCYIFLLALDIKRSAIIPVRSENVELVKFQNYHNENYQNLNLKRHKLL